MSTEKTSYGVELYGVQSPWDQMDNPLAASFNESVSGAEEVPPRTATKTRPDQAASTGAGAPVYSVTEAGDTEFGGEFADDDHKSLWQDHQDESTGPNSLMSSWSGRDETHRMFKRSYE
ncbi:hypothetical protein Q5741_14175 [Paenibacillus sp. JX-17]|uniref:Uncharacterized protein n=1 Tax=Paenibacillus lacisoli TaxID=3064525 RepID=A0ABT9CE82_9BACL|nr:hypothetical protein [Paenibacillus sp. JX-17]MDO7907552.1 hypothetical protein [Paenibacillus sp. JX-17]